MGEGGRGGKGPRKTLGQAWGGKINGGNEKWGAMARLKGVAMPAGLTLAWSHSKSLTQADPSQLDRFMASPVCSTSPSGLMSANNSGMGPQPKVFGTQKCCQPAWHASRAKGRFSSAL